MTPITQARWYPERVLNTRHHRRGSYAIMVALLMIVLLGFAALAIDLSYLRLARLQAQNAADAGAHAALTEFRVTRDEDAARARAVQIVNLNRVAGDPAVTQNNEKHFLVFQTKTELGLDF